jgi:two-component system response regulator FlrC
MDERPLAAQRRRVVLVVDDDASVREAVCLVLEDDYECLAARSGEVALDLLRSSRVDVVVLDLRMPGSDGVAVLRAMLAEHPELPVVVLTAVLEKDAIAEAMSLGARDYVVKPFRHERLHAAIRGALTPRAPGGPEPPRA